MGELDNEPEPSPTTQPKKMGKCQAVDVSFLKKNASEAQAEAQRQEQAMRDFLLMQQRAKKEPVTLRYAFRSEATQRELPTGVHFGTVEVLKGCTAVIGRKEERDLMLAVGAGGQSIGSFIIPPALTLVELSAKRWSEGHSLFEDFKDGIVVTERRWYEQMRHTFPY